MGNLSLTLIISSGIVIVATLFLLKNLFVILTQGKLIVKTEEIQLMAIFGVIILIIEVYLLFKNIASYNQRCDEAFISNILTNAAVSELMLIWIVRTILSYEIREKGISNYVSFYKWSRVKGYEWVSTYEIQFKVKTIFNPNKLLKFRIFEDRDKLEVNEALKKNRIQ